MAVVVMNVNATNKWEGIFTIEEGKTKADIFNNSLRLTYMYSII